MLHQILNLATVSLMIRMTLKFVLSPTEIQINTSLSLVRDLLLINKSVLLTTWSLETGWLKGIYTTLLDAFHFLRNLDVGSFWICGEKISFVILARKLKNSCSKSSLFWIQCLELIFFVTLTFAHKWKISGFWRLVLSLRFSHWRVLRVFSSGREHLLMRKCKSSVRNAEIMLEWISCKQCKI